MSEPDVTQPEPIPRAVASPPVPYHWFHKISAVLFVVFCLELGLFLVIYPWTDGPGGWDQNWFATALSLKLPRWNEYWLNAYLRGAVSGLGLVDLYISVGEIVRLRRFTRS